VSPGLRERKNAAVNEAIFTAALGLFAERGFEPVSVDEIAERAGVSRTTFFNHFGSKEGVLRFYGGQLQQKLDELIRRISPDLPPLQRLREVLACVAGEAAAHRGKLRLIYLYSISDPTYLTGLTPAREQIWQMVTRVVQEGQALGQFRGDLPARDLAMNVLSLMNSATLLHIMTGAPIDPLVDSTWRFLLGGITHADAATQ